MKFQLWFWPREKNRYDLNQDDLMYSISYLNCLGKVKYVYFFHEYADAEQCCPADLGWDFIGEFS